MLHATVIWGTHLKVCPRVAILFPANLRTGLGNKTRPLTHSIPPGPDWLQKGTGYLSGLGTRYPSKNLLEHSGRQDFFFLSAGGELTVFKDKAVRKQRQNIFPVMRDE